MSDTAPEATIFSDALEIRFPTEKAGLLSRLTGKGGAQHTFGSLPDDHRDLLLALGDLRGWEDTHPGEVEITDDLVRVSHDAAASLSAPAAAALGLPPDTQLMLKTDVTGTLGSPAFRLHYEWSDNGRPVRPSRQGAILETAQGPRRVPLWMKRALDMADSFDANAPIEEHWKTLSEFRRALEPDEDDDDEDGSNSTVARLAMTSFLRGLEVHVADRFSISPDSTLGQFEIVPFSSSDLRERGVQDDAVSEGDGELHGDKLAAFQSRISQRGARPAYQLGNNSYLVVDKASQPVLEEMSRAQQSDREQRKAFIQNPRAYIHEAVSRRMEADGALEGLDPVEQEEAVSALAEPAFIESREYSDRVTGTVVYEKPAGQIEGSGTSWLPEVFSAHVAEAIKDMRLSELEALRSHMAEALKEGASNCATIGGEEVQVTPERLNAVEAALEQRRKEEESPPSEEGSEEQEQVGGPIILDTLDNYEELSWHAKLAPRFTAQPPETPPEITTSLRQHQVQSFDWAVSAWKSGLPGILNADEQGLGKTLQTISFLCWLKAHMASDKAKSRGPVLVVAPTSLLRNWEAEVEQHVAPRKFGHLIRLYGSRLSGQKRPGAQGTETRGGLPLLDLDWLDEALEEGRAHRYWILTTYTTLANYQHSLGRIPFSALVMDEIQNIKNRDTIASRAAEAMNADFRIGLTGTPIENTTLDLWTIMDRIAPGALGSGLDFRSRYDPPDEENMAELHGRVFRSVEGVPPLGLRRLKEEVAKELPSKTRLLHPRQMPRLQAQTYDEARKKMAADTPGAALKMLHHIRSVSVHPALHSVAAPGEFIAASARLEATMEILSRIKAQNERALVFIEHREMQFRFAEIVRHTLGLNKIDVINGDTPIPRRQEIVNRFQQHLHDEPRFDMLILGPKAAGTGLTLTAANHVIHLSRWWNPAVEEQCNDRVHRIGQQQPVTVHVPMAVHPGYRENSFDCLLQSLMQRKRRMASQALWPMGDSAEDTSALRSGLSSSAASNDAGASLNDIMRAIYARDGLPPPEPNSNGAFVFP